MHVIVFKLTETRMTTVPRRHRQT